MRTLISALPPRAVALLTLLGAFIVAPWVLTLWLASWAAVAAAWGLLMVQVGVR